ncbi:hypothetical protein Golax_022075 [Gossypium laxum]|uniref:Uncharacterized protein n=1 Tax=Gossypium laxum TaxID=34288 RepID=A0A7J9AN23_9ROSI|nr:hypothetical protein [Gossypium laxum]
MYLFYQELETDQVLKQLKYIELVCTIVLIYFTNYSMQFVFCCCCTQYLNINNAGRRVTEALSYVCNLGLAQGIRVECGCGKDHSCLGGGFNISHPLQLSPRQSAKRQKLNQTKNCTPQNGEDETRNAQS